MIRSYKRKLLPVLILFTVLFSWFICAVSLLITGPETESLTVSTINKNSSQGIPSSSDIIKELNSFLKENNLTLTVTTDQYYGYYHSSDSFSDCILIRSGSPYELLLDDGLFLLDNSCSAMVTDRTDLFHGKDVLYPLNKLSSPEGTYYFQQLSEPQKTEFKSLLAGCIVSDREDSTPLSGMMDLLTRREFLMILFCILVSLISFHQYHRLLLKSQRQQIWVHYICGADSGRQSAMILKQILPELILVIILNFVTYFVFNNYLFEVPFTASLTSLFLLFLLFFLMVFHDMSKTLKVLRRSR